MNISIIGRSTESYGGNHSKSIFAGNLSVMRNMGLKSTEEKSQRQQKTDSQVEFWENQKQNLKAMECGTVEEIARKLEMYHTYEDEIAAAKAAYNSEQIFHTLDEAKELGEKIAEYTEKLEPKTPEERKEEMVEEALGTEENKGMLEEVLDEVEEILEEAEEELLEEEMQGTAALTPDTGATDSLKDAAEETQKPEAAKYVPYDSFDPAQQEWIKNYRPMDIRA